MKGSHQGKEILLASIQEQPKQRNVGICLTLPPQTFWMFVWIPSLYIRTQETKSKLDQEFMKIKGNVVHKAMKDNAKKWASTKILIHFLL